MEVGWFSDKIYPANKEVFYGFTTGRRYGKKEAVYAASVAAANEYGGGNRPPRPFMRDVVRKHQKDWRDKLYVMLNDNPNLKRAFKHLGADIVEEIHDTIAKWTNPPNSPTTIKIKGFNNPLVDSGRMMDDFLDMRIK